MLKRGPYDALLYVSFGGPERPEDVLPFLQNVTRGRGVPAERLVEVAAHYAHFGGKSPINERNREIIEALRAELGAHDLPLPIYFGNRNWHPMLPATLRQMANDGVTRALAYVTSAFSSYSGCRQYLENIDAARQEVGAGAPVVDKLRTFHDHPGFIDAWVERTNEALARLSGVERDRAALAFTAHSIPESMAQTSRYAAEVAEAARLVGERIGRTDGVVVYQSRSGSPEVPWLGPDVLEHVRSLDAERVRHLVVVPIGFLSDHVEVLYDLDVEARELAKARGIELVRAVTVGAHPRMISAIRELVTERIRPDATRLALGVLGVVPDVCATDCCPAPVRRRP